MCTDSTLRDTACQSLFEFIYYIYARLWCKANVLYQYIYTPPQCMHAEMNDALMLRMNSYVVLVLAQLNVYSWYIKTVSLVILQEILSKANKLQWQF